MIFVITIHCRKKAFLCLNLLLPELHTSGLTLSSWESAIMKTKKKSISILIENLAKKGNDEYIQMIYEMNEKGENITNDYEKDTVPEEILLALLEKSTKDDRIQALLLSIMFDGEINANSISDKIFEYCLNYPTPWKDTLLMILAHMPLKKEQLEQLNNVIEDHEAFYQLFLINISDNNLPIKQFRKFLLENEKHLSLLFSFQEYMIGQNINQDKIKLTNKLVREHLDISNYNLPTNYLNAFSSLFLLNLYDDNFSIKQFRDFLLHNKNHLSLLADFRERIYNQSLNQDKIKLTNKLVREQLEKSLFLLNLYDNNFSVAEFREFMFENEKNLNILAHWWKYEREILLRRQDICQEKAVFFDQLMREKIAKN